MVLLQNKVRLGARQVKDYLARPGFKNICKHTTGRPRSWWLALNCLGTIPFSASLAFKEEEKMKEREKNKNKRRRNESNFFLARLLLRR